MKKFLAIIAIASFVACNNSGEDKAAADDSARRADSIRIADSTANANKMMEQPKPDSSAMKPDSSKMQKK